MLQAELKDLDSTDQETGYDLASFVPTDSESFGVEVTAHIGVRGEPGADLFYFTVCTPKWLSKQEFEKGFRWGAHHLIVKQWDLGLIQRAISDLCVRAVGPDWKTIAAYIGRFGNWEFEDYREEP